MTVASVLAVCLVLDSPEFWGEEKDHISNLVYLNADVFTVYQEDVVINVSMCMYFETDGVY